MCSSFLFPRYPEVLEFLPATMDFIPFVITAVILFFIFSWMIKCCCTKTTNPGMVITTTPVVITSETHHIAAPGATQAVPAGVVVQGYPTGSAAYPTAYPSQHVPPPQFPAQPYVQSYPYQTTAAPLPPAQGVTPYQGSPSVQFPALPAQMTLPMPPTSATAPPPMVNPPSYDQVVGDPYRAQAPYNPDFKG